MEKCTSEDAIFGCFAAAEQKVTIDETAGSFVDVEEYENGVMYPSFAQWAKKAGYPEISRLFSKVAGEELLHAKWMRELYEQMGTPESGEDTVRAKRALKQVNENLEKLADQNPELLVERALKVAIRVENREWQEIYPKFRDQAVKDGNEVAAKIYQRVIDSEREHAGWFEAALRDIQTKKENRPQL